MKSKSHFVFDTNALISAALLPASISKQALKKAESLGTVFLSKESLSELAEVLSRSKFDKYLSLEKRLEFIDRVEARYTLIEVVSNFEDCRDESDNKFLNLAFDSNASCLISGDKDLLELHPYHNISILTPADFLHNS